ncbi:hypothetical protein EDD36DRAFT_473233 [Exophiala viscosa]|uniref:Uncharacterized protein n=1 Tax=Exophiala viscosa TaxID=2486360 RepID=A0AAN6IEY0_9EURO|nr:hypothetical protein EDD36DRAFT_473233 [Exophiala viscosa]
MMLDKVAVQPNSIPASTSWETRLAKYFRELASVRGYDAPADENWVVAEMEEISGFLDRGVRRYQDAQHGITVSMHVVRPQTPNDSLLTYLRALCGRSAPVMTYLPRAYAAAAIYQWVFCCTFEENVELGQNTYFADALALLAHDDTKVVRRLKGIKYLDYLETTVRPTSPTIAEVTNGKNTRWLPALFYWSNNGLLYLYLRATTRSSISG